MQQISIIAEYQQENWLKKRKLPRFSNSPVEVQTSNQFNQKKAVHKQMPGNLDGLKQLYKVSLNSSRVM